MGLLSQCDCSPFVLPGMSFSGREFDAMSPEQQRKACQSAKLFSRVEPAHKSKIVDYLQKDGAVAAMVRRIQAGTCRLYKHL